MIKRPLFFLIGTLDKGGAEMIFSNLLNEFSKNNSCYLILTTNNIINYKLNDNIKIICLKNKLFPFKALEIRNLFQKFEPRLCISFVFNVNVLLIISSFFFNFKKVVCVRSDLRDNPFFYYITRFLFKFSTDIVYQTKQLMESHDVKVNNTTCKKHVIPNYYDKTIFKNDYLDKNLLTASRFVPSKNIINLIDIYIDLSKNDFKGHLIIIGEGPLENEIRNYIKIKNLENKVLIKKWEDDLENIYKSGFIYCSTSLSEGFPNSILNAVAHGLVALAYNSSPGIETILKSSSKFSLIKTHDTKEFVNKIIKLNNDHMFYSEIKKSQLKYIKANFSKDIVLNKWKKILI